MALASRGFLEKIIMRVILGQFGEKLNRIKV